MSYEGEVGILNVGAGDTKLSFDKSNPAERERAAKIVADMLKRGYAILIQVGEKDGKPLFHRATSFEPETCEYIIVGLPEGIESPLTTDADCIQDDHARPHRRQRVAADKTRAVAVAPIAGG